MCRLFPAIFKGSACAGCRCRSRHAFSLVEVAISLGILSFVAVSIVGLSSVGMTSMRENEDRSIEAQVSDWARTAARQRIEQGEFAAMADSVAGFDERGIYLGPGEVGAAYSAHFRPSEKTLPGSDEKLLGVEVEIRVPIRGGRTIATHAFLFNKP